MEKRKKLCPQCSMPSFYVMNEEGERLPVYVYNDGEIVAKHEKDSLEGYDLNRIYCFGCSWKGNPKHC